MQVDVRWAGTMGFSPDSLPVYGTLPGVEGSIWAAGFTGHGMAYGFRFGKLLADVVADRGGVDEADLFSVDRFDAAAHSAAASAAS